LNDINAIWPIKPTLEQIAARNRGTMVEHLGILFIAIDEVSITATMPVDARTKQPAGILHGGANVVLAETLGSVAGNCVVPENKMVVGVEINANHLRAVKDGLVTGVCTALHLGGRTQVWEIKIYDEQQRLSCVSRLTCAVVDKALP
jgi:1,4-dihydroxy-2-naphthoyl-CoA hydrolase